MSHLPYPVNAPAIAEARANGMRPSGPLLVVMSGTFDFDNATVLARAGTRYRWDWVRALPSVIVLIGRDTKLGTILADIEEHQPNQLDVIDHERGLGWMVTATRPSLKTVRWQRWQVADWLGDQQWHLKLQAHRQHYALVAA